MWFPPLFTSPPAGALAWAIKHRKGIVVAIAALVLAVLIWCHGAAHVQAKWDKDKKDQALAAAQVAQKQAEASVQVVTKYVDRVQLVQGKTKEIIKEVPVYVPASADADCVINRGFVWLHDAAAANFFPIAAGVADAAPSGIALSAVAETVADNYGSCHENAEQLKALQAWVSEMITTSHLGR